MNQKSLNKGENLLNPARISNGTSISKEELRDVEALRWLGMGILSYKVLTVPILNLYLFLVDIYIKYIGTG
jgi:hypothetical protein